MISLIKTSKISHPSPFKDKLLFKIRMIHSITTPHSQKIWQAITYSMEALLILKIHVKSNHLKRNLSSSGAPIELDN